MDEQRDHPTADHPLHGEPRPRLVPALALVGFVVAVVAVFLLITWLA
jgi:hypothetical protein